MERVTAFDELYGLYARDVFRFVLYLSGNRGTADDITSETFVRVWTARRDLRVATAKAYLFAIARNLYRQQWRRERRRVPIDDTRPDRAPGPHVLAQDAAALQEVLADLQELAEVDRAALLMRAQDEMPYSEIAAALGLSLTAVKVKIHRARLRLAERRLARRKP